MKGKIHQTGYITYGNKNGFLGKLNKSPVFIETHFYTLTEHNKIHYLSRQNRNKFDKITHQMVSLMKSFLLYCTIFILHGETIEIMWE